MQMSQTKFNISLDKPLYRTSIMRLIIIDKSEYYLSYSHDDIDIKIDRESKNNFPIGKIVIVQKNPDKNGNVIKLSSHTMMSKDSINMSLLNNDPLLVYKIVCLLEGTYQNKEIFKLDLEKKEIKIITNVKEGITLKLFSCVLEEEILSDYGDVLCSFISSFKKKKEMSKEFDKQIEELKEKEGNVNKKLAITKTEVIKRENKILMLFCNKLNEKKEQLRQLKTIIDNDGMDLKEDDNQNNIINSGTELQKHNSSGLKFDDSQKNSNNLSLLDL